MEEGLELREVLAYGPGEHVIDPGDIPWLEGLRMFLRGGDGGRSSTGEPGGPGQSVVTDLYKPVGPQRIRVAAGGRGVGGAEDGQDGCAIVELYGRHIQA